MHLIRGFVLGAGDRDRTGMASLEDETRASVTREFAWLRRRSVTETDRCCPFALLVLGT